MNDVVAKPGEAEMIAISAYLASISP